MHKTSSTGVLKLPQNIEFRGPLSAPLSHAHRGLRRLGFFLDDALHFLENDAFEAERSTAVRSV
jgi:hypothetical protein